MFYFLLALLLHLFYLASDPFLPDAPPERPFSPTTDDYLIDGLVHPITGQFSLVLTDLVANGTEPIALTRHYYPPLVQARYSKNKKEDEHFLSQALSKRFGWIFFPHLIAEWHTLDSKGRAFITITEPDGSMLVFKKHKSGSITLESKGPFTNSNGQIISSTLDARNTSISLEGSRIVVNSKDGSTRFYEYSHSSEEKRSYHLKKERLSNGRWIVYSYDNKSLSSIETKDPHERYTYAKLTRSKDGWVTHTGQKASYQFG